MFDGIHNGSQFFAGTAIARAKIHEHELVGFQGRMVVAQRKAGAYGGHDRLTQTNPFAQSARKFGNVAEPIIAEVFGELAAATISNGVNEGRFAFVEFGNSLRKISFVGDAETRGAFEVVLRVFLRQAGVENLGVLTCFG